MTTYAERIGWRLSGDRPVAGSRRDCVAVAAEADREVAGLRSRLQVAEIEIEDLREALRLAARQQGDATG